ncbi:MAG: hypothetical protein AAGM36_05815 [Cyanobacteria bacterium J06597_1]
MSNSVQALPTPEEIQSMIAELEAYRARIFDETIAVAKKAKLPKKLVIEQLEKNPDVVKIDGALTQLKAQLAAQ